MHRQRTRFATRVHRVATALERRGVVATYELHDRVLANRASRRRFTREPPALDAVQQRIVDELRREGYATVPLSELVPEPGVWDELEADGERFRRPHSHARRAARDRSSAVVPARSSSCARTPTA